MEREAKFHRDLCFQFAHFMSVKSPLHFGINF